MIFATVGTQLPFNRLIGALDQWQKNNCDNKVLVQIGAEGEEPQHCHFLREVRPSQFEKIVADCKVIVSHCGIGSVFTALKAKKPIIVMPRRAAFGEHRNDHQLATAAQLAHVAGISVVDDEYALQAELNRLHELSAAASLFPPYASTSLISAIQTFIQNDWEG